MMRYLRHSIHPQTVFLLITDAQLQGLSYVLLSGEPNPERENANLNTDL
jgi:hypothetical protein